MPDKYDIDYAQQVTELLPPDKRYKNITAWLTTCMASTLQYLRDALVDDYRNGSTVSAWVDPAVSGTPYARGAKVNYKKAIFVSLVDANASIPTDTDNWYMQQQFFIGLVERLAYNGQNIVLTYALNRWFGATFRQPGSGLSDIYITTANISANAFLVGSTDFNSSLVGANGSVDMVDGILPTPQYNCTINVPSAVFTSLGSAAEALIRAFADQYIYAGVIYNVATY